jgi:hypothetical protein
MWIDTHYEGHRHVISGRLSNGVALFHKAIHSGRKAWLIESCRERESNGQNGQNGQSKRPLMRP